MKCKECKKDMILLKTHDNIDTGYAYNIFHCDDCALTLINHVWNDARDMWIYENAKINVEEFWEKSRFDGK